MATKRFNYKPLYPGFDWAFTLVINASPALFPEGVKLRAQVRTDEGEPVLATLSTDGGHFIRIDDNTIGIAIHGDLSHGWEEGSVMFDLVRVDGEAEVHLGIRITVTTQTSLTDPV